MVARGVRDVPTRAGFAVEDTIQARRDRWLRAYFDASTDLVAALDDEARLLDVNPAAERLLGAFADTLRGASSQQLGLSAAAFATWRVAIRQVFDAQHDQLLDLELATPLGPRQYVARLSAVMDERRRVDFVSASLRDVTDRVHLEEDLKSLHHELLAREDRLQALLGSLLGERSMLRERVRAWGLSRLAARERAILRLLANGRTNREIALELGLSPGTVKNRIGLLLPKLGAADRTQAVAIALQLGLLSAPVQSGGDSGPGFDFNLGAFE
jgi:PAS domain S-box-containing protein